MRLDIAESPWTPKNTTENQLLEHLEMLPGLGRFSITS
jgi:hypothetical protein